MTARVVHEGGLTVVEIADDGCGGADASGSGLQGLADRVAALGGSFASPAWPGRARRCGPNCSRADDADDWLHLALAVGLIALGLLTTRDRDRTVSTT